jgi:hypothetical protein
MSHEHFLLFDIWRISSRDLKENYYQLRPEEWKFRIAEHKIMKRHMQHDMPAFKRRRNTKHSRADA